MYHFFEKNLYKILLFLGFLVGATFGIALQDGVYNSQIVGELVKYKPTDLMYIWGNTNWSITAQLPALAMNIGVNELYCSVVISIILTMMSFLSLGNFLNAITKNATHSILLTLFTYYSLHYLFGVGYEVSMISWDIFNSTLGMFGFHFCVLALSFFFSKNYKVSFFLLGLSICVHIFQSIYIHIFFITYFCLNRELMKKGYIKSYILGFIVSCISFIFYMSKINQSILGNLSVSHEDMKNFILLWDDHRLVDVKIYSGAIVSNILFPVIVYLIDKKDKVDFKIKFWSYFCCSVTSLIFLSLKTGIYESSTMIIMAMPEKLIGFGLYLNIPIIFALILKSNSFKVTKISTLVILFITFINRFNLLSINLEHIPIYILSIILISLLLDQIYNKIISLKKLDLAVLFLFPLLLIIDLFSWPKHEHNYTKLKRSYNSSFNHFLKSTNDYILVSPKYKGSYIQMLTRKKVIFDPTELTDIPYSPTTFYKSLPMMNELYGIDLRNPGATYMIHHKRGEVSNRFVKSIWEARELSKWIDLKNTYKFNYIVVPITWELNIKNSKLFKEGKIYYFKKN